jgi:hypothetical protein
MTPFTRQCQNIQFAVDKQVFYCQKLPKEIFLFKIVGMERAEIKLITDYLEGLEEGFDEWDYRGMNASYVTKEQSIKERFTY